MYDRNFEAIHRAGADFVLGETALSVRMTLSVLHERELIVIGEGVDVFVTPVPPSLAGKKLADSGIGAQTGLNVIGLQRIPEPGGRAASISSELASAPSKRAPPARPPRAARWGAAEGWWRPPSPHRRPPRAAFG